MPNPPGPRVVEVENISKHFSVPGAAPRGTLNRFLHPVQRGKRRTLRVLDRISFDVHRGELFGIVGRNGSGKSTLLRILGSIYGADAGRISITGAVAPFIELGVGFQPQMSARQNVTINGVLLGLGRREVRRRVDEVLAYAELEEFADVQLKNFSSGMRVRLAFASMLQADPDIYLIDEILAVGDEAFREKCAGDFAALKERGKTILMVTHSPGVIEQQADRAMLLHDGRVATIGDPGEVLATYRSKSLRKAESGGPPQAERSTTTGDRQLSPPAPGRNARRATSGERGRKSRGRARGQRATIANLIFAGTEGSDPPRIASGEPLRLRIEADASGWVHGPTIKLAVTDEGGSKVLVTRDSDRDRLPVLRPGEKFAAELTVENPLAPGRYRLDCVLMYEAEGRKGPVSPVRSLDFEVDGDAGDRLAPEGSAGRPATTIELIR